MNTAAPQGGHWHQQTSQAALSRLGVEATQGLSPGEVRTRLEQHGANEIKAAARHGPARILLRQFTDFMILVLVVAAVISGIVGEPLDAAAIVVIVLLNAIIGAVQEYRAERAVEALRDMAAPEAQVRREGTRLTIPASGLVPGDIVLLEAGGIVPADLRLLEAAELNIDEAALTGESHTAGKQTSALSESALPIADRRNMAYKGTLVTSGRGHGVVVATGMHTELGHVATLLREGGIQKTPLQRRLTHFGRRLAIAVLAICAMIFALGLLRGEPAVLMFLTAVTLAVAAIPEALPAVVTVSLAFGARKMSRHQSLIRRLPAVETLGSVTYICSDKTGTLTENRMQVDTVLVDGQHRPELVNAADAGRPWDLLGQAMALSNDVHARATGGISGEPTEVALFQAAEAAGFNRRRLEQLMPRVAEIPFASQRQCMSTVHRTNGQYTAFIKGAPEKVLPLCIEAHGAEAPVTLDHTAMQTAADALAHQGYRVMAFATRDLTAVPEPLQADVLERDLSFLALVGLIDPPRSEAPESVALCQSAGIRPVMITGDHAGTAHAIAMRLGLARQDDTVMTGPELEQLTPQQLEARVTDTPVFARVNPEQKIKIVKALQARGEFVAMTGDGVNDAPALKRADIGVAMGQKGTDVAREAADMVLLDDNFATIVTAVAEGRRIFDNIRKFIKYTMTSNSGEIWTLLLAPFLGLPVPLLPIHILWINLVTDGLPGLAFTAEPADPGLMRRRPRPPNESIFAHGIWQHIIWVGLLIGGLSIASQAWTYTHGAEYWQTVVFTVLTISQLFHSMAVRSERTSLFHIGLSSNLPMLGAVLLTTGLQLAVIYVPVLNTIFKTQPLPLADLAACFAVSSVVLVAVEVEKWLVRHGRLYGPQTGP